MSNSKWWWSANTTVDPGDPIHWSLYFRGGQYLQWSAPNFDDNTDMRYTLSVWAKNNSMIEDQAEPIFARNSTSSASSQGFKHQEYRHLEDGTSTVYRTCNDPHAWYHIFVKVTTQQYANPATGSIWINGQQVANNVSTLMSLHPSSTRYRIGGGGDSLGSYFDGLLADYHFLAGVGSDQTLTHEDFGRFNDSGIWVPRNLPDGTDYGDHGFHLTFDPSQTNGIGHDSSGEGHHFTANNWTSNDTWDYAYSSHDRTPTKLGAFFNTLARLSSSNKEVQWAQQIWLEGISSNHRVWGTNLAGAGLPTAGKHIFMINTGTNSANMDNGGRLGIGILVSDDINMNNYGGSNSTPSGDNSYFIQRSWKTNNNRINVASGTTSVSGSTPEAPTGWQSNQVNGAVVCAWDGDTRRVWFGYIVMNPDHNNWTGNIIWIGDNGSEDTNANPATGANPFATIPDDVNSIFGYAVTGQRSGLTGRARIAPTGWFDEINNLPDGFNRLELNNYPPSAIPNARNHFEVITYEGNATARTIDIEQDFRPGLVWLKNRSNLESHLLFDDIRAEDDYLSTDTQLNETANDQSLTAFNDDSFDLGTSVGNTDGDNYVAYVWEAGGRPTISNTEAAGSAPTAGSVMIDGAQSTDVLAGTKQAVRISANTTSGFSIIRYRGDQTAGTVPHCLDENKGAPALVLVKKYSGGSTSNKHWVMYHRGATSSGEYMRFTNDGALTSSNAWNETDPTTTTISLGSATLTNETNQNFIAYVWQEIPGFSAFGTYTGNGSSDGPTIYLGFKPAFVLIKRYSDSGNSWNIFDSGRNDTNPMTAFLKPDTNQQESNTNKINFFSMGFKCVSNASATNTNTEDFLYIAFAQNPYGGSNIVPVTAY